MHSISQEFLVLCRALGDAQKRCTAAVAAMVGQEAQIRTLEAQVVRLRAAVIVRDTRFAMAREEIDQMKLSHTGVPRRMAMARHLALLVERIGSLSRECLRWRLAATAVASVPKECATALMPAALDTTDTTDATQGRALVSAFSGPALADSLAAADWVICQTGCISHDDYWRVQDHCRRTGKTCILVGPESGVCVPPAPAIGSPVGVLRVLSVAPATDNGGVGSDTRVTEKNSG